jgi:uncharacterized protein YigE (DUF2233 family)
VSSLSLRALRLCGKILPCSIFETISKYQLMKSIISLSILIILFGINCYFTTSQEVPKTPDAAPIREDTSSILSYIVHPKVQNLSFRWKDDKGENFKSFQQLKTWLHAQNQALVFAMNGGMFMEDRTPLGLYIENGKTLKKINTIKEAYGNFYFQPNGIFYLTNEKEAVICKTTDFKANENIQFATQSGPLLIIDGSYHPKINRGSTSLHYRNGVGVLPNGNVLFAMSTKPVNFYEFATFFKEQGCQNALYLDGFVSKTYLPSKNSHDLGGNFGVIICETKAIR